MFTGDDHEFNTDKTKPVWKPCASMFAYPLQALQRNILGPRTKVKLSLCVLGEETQRAVNI
jgi:hypothetical protein